jgi:polysaccharide pyruvyl transferase WcaK-like protein
MAKIISPRVVVGNRGDLLSRFAILASLRRLGHEVSVFCHSSRDVAPLDLPRLRYGSLYNLLPPLRGWFALLRARTVLWTGGLDLQDDSSLLKLVHTLVLFLVYRLLGCQIVVAMQGAGPLTKRTGRWLARRILGLVECFIARDSGTLRLLQELGADAWSVRAYDGIFLRGLDDLQTRPSEDACVDEMATCRPGQPLIGVNIRLWFHFSGSILPYHFAKGRYLERSHERMDQLIDATIRLVARLRGQFGARVVLLSMYEPDTHPWEDDLPHLERVKAAFADDDDVILVNEPLTLGAFCRLVGHLDLMIGARLHSTLTALRFGVPACNLAYTNKCFDIFRDLGLAPNLVDLERFMQNPECVIELARSALNDAGLRQRLRTLVQARIEENEQVLRHVFGEIQPAVERQRIAG